MIAPAFRLPKMIMTMAIANTASPKVQDVSPCCLVVTLKDKSRFWLQSDIRFAVEEEEPVTTSPKSAGKRTIPEVRIPSTKAKGPKYHVPFFAPVKILYSEKIMAHMAVNMIWVATNKNTMITVGTRDFFFSIRFV